MLVWHDGGLDAVANDGAGVDGDAKRGLLWHWSDPDAQIVDVAAHGDRVVVLAVADGRSVLVDLVDGVEIERSEADSAGSDTLTTTAIGFDDGVLHLGVEGPLTPPRIVERPKESATIAPPPVETLGATVRTICPPTTARP